MKFEVTIKFQVDSEEYNIIPDLQEVKELALAMIRSEADWPDLNSEIEIKVEVPVE